MRRGWMAALPVLAGCAYYNTMWRAEQFAREARGMEARGRTAEARLAWARATTKAESVLARHPGSRWADDALVLKGEGLARSGNCRAAQGPLEEARRTVDEPALLERASLAAADCALLAGNMVRAAELAAAAAESRDGRRRALAAHVAGQAAWARGDVDLALERYAQSTLTAAALARTRALFQLGRMAEGRQQIAAIGGRAVAPDDWAALLDVVARSAGPETASQVLDKILAGATLAGGARGRLLVADGDRLRAAGLADAAAARYRAVLALVPDSLEGRLALGRLTLARAARARDTAELRLVLAGLGAAGAEDGRSLVVLLRHVLGPHREAAAAFRAAELARDSLNARPLAGALFLDLARRAPESIFAPKALVAALWADAEPRDSILEVLRSRYPSSPYTLALAGAAGPAYAVAEDSLAQALGVAVAALPATIGASTPAPVPGPRGPFLDVVFRTAGGASPTVPDRERSPVRDRERIR